MLNSRVLDCQNAVPTIRQRVYTEYTPTACMTHIQSVHKHARMGMGMRTCGSRLSSCIIFAAPKRIHLQVNHLTPMLVVPAPSHFQSTARSTSWTARPSPRPQCTPTTTSARTSSSSCRTNSSVSPYQQTQSGRKTTLKNHSQTLNMSAGNLRNNTPTGYEPDRRDCDDSDDVSGRGISINKTMYRVNLENKINKLQLWKKREDLDKMQVQSLLDQEMAKMSPIWKMSYRQSRMHFDESMESEADSDLEDGEIRKLLTPTTVWPKSFWETRCHGH